MHTLKDWSASRSGPAMTVTGSNESGMTVKLTGIKKIEVRKGKVMAIGADSAIPASGFGGERMPVGEWELVA